MDPWMNFTFCQINDFRNLVESFQNDPGIIDKKFGIRNETILHKASLNRRVEMVDFLLDKGAHQIPDGNGNYPLHCAALGGDSVVTRKLIDAGADLESCNHDFDKPLHLASGVGNLEVVKALLDAGADIRSRGFLANTAIHTAAEAAQVEVMEELVERGLEVEITNAKGEHPIHLAAGVAGKINDIRHLEYLLLNGANIKKSRNNDGHTAAHYAAQSGPVEALKLLLDAECPVTKAKLNEEQRWQTVEAGNTLLEYTAESGCSKKGSLLLNKVLAARYKECRTRAKLVNDLERDKNSYEELTPQELELSCMYNELENSLENPKSVIRMFLQNCPESIESLLNDCILVNKDHPGKVSFNFFLFHMESDVAPIDLVIATGKKKMIVHPLFETFICLKWQKVRKLFTISFSLLVVHMIALVGYSLFSFSPSCQAHGMDNSFEYEQRNNRSDNETLMEKIDCENVENQKWIAWIFFLITNISVFLLQLSKLYGIFFWRFQRKRQKSYRSLSQWVERQERLYPLLDTFFPICGFFFLVYEKKELSVFLILYSSWQCMRIFSMFPRIGKNVFITSKVTRTVTEFFLSYLIVFIAFTLSFHILLPHTAIFSDLGDSFVKVITMLLGEFEYTDLVESEETTWWAKLVFLIFIVLMSIVLINLVIGLSINDIARLRKEAHLHNLINTVSAIKSVEHLVSSLNKVFPCLHYSTQLTSSNSNTCQFEDQVYMDISNLDYTNQHYIQVTNDRPEKYECPKKIVESVASIVHNRLQGKTGGPTHELQRNALLKKIAKFEDDFVEGVCKTFH